MKNGEELGIAPPTPGGEKKRGDRDRERENKSFQQRPGSQNKNIGLDLFR